MLVFSRKVNESIVINDDITITVVEIGGDKVRLGVAAPLQVPVHRREVFDAIHRLEAQPAAPPPRPAAAPARAADGWIEEDLFFG
jgi:carbon storage regulator